MTRPAWKMLNNLYSISFFHRPDGMNFRNHHVMHCVHENLAANSQSSARAGTFLVVNRASSALTSIGPIKLRSPASAATAARAAAQHAGDRIIFTAILGKGRPRLPLRSHIIPESRATDLVPRNRPPITPRGTGDIQNFAGFDWQNTQMAPRARGPARPAPASRGEPRRGTSFAFRRRLRRSSCTSFAAPPEAPNFIPFPGKPPHSAPATTRPAIARPARRVNVGLTVTREDHVTKIPVVFVRRPAQSGE